MVIIIKLIHKIYVLKLLQFRFVNKLVAVYTSFNNVKQITNFDYLYKIIIFNGKGMLLFFPQNICSILHYRLETTFLAFGVRTLNKLV